MIIYDFYCDNADETSKDNPCKDCEHFAICELKCLYDKNATNEQREKAIKILKDE